jgi:integrase
VKRRQDINVFAIQDRRQYALAKRPWIVRWAIDGKQRSKSFRTKIEADRYRSSLVQAHVDGELFDRQTGEPTSWQRNADELMVLTWAQRWLGEQWDEWQPRTRTSAVEALERFVAIAVSPEAPTPPADLRSHLLAVLPPQASSGDPESGRWLDRWGLSLGQLDRSLLANVDRRLGLGDTGQALSPSTAARYRKVSRACIRRAVDLEVLPVDPWPPAPRGRSSRKSARSRRAIDVRSLPDPTSMAEAIAAIRSHQPASRMYEAMTAVLFYAGLRPSEVVMLRAGSVDLPASGWGRLDVNEADISFDEPGEPKTGPRSVPIPPQLVVILREWVEAHDFGGGDLLFRTRTGKRPTASNWSRAWKRALSAVGHPPMRLYDCRHAAATTWLSAGVPLGEVARRMGHSVETLVSTYVGALAGDEELANERIGAVLG